MRMSTRPTPTSTPSNAANSPPPPTDNRGGLAGTVHRFERRVGLYRPGRSPWVWILGPGLNLLGTTAIILWVGLAAGLGAAATVPLAVFCGLAMGVMAWAFLGTSWEQEQDERRAAEVLRQRPHRRSG
jgi:hypothetical protein